MVLLTAYFRPPASGKYASGALTHEFAAISSSGPGKLTSSSFSSAVSRNRSGRKGFTPLLLSTRKIFSDGTRTTQITRKNAAWRNLSSQIPSWGTDCARAPATPQVGAARRWTAGQGSHSHARPGGHQLGLLTLHDSARMPLPSVGFLQPATRHPSASSPRQLRAGTRKCSVRTE